MNELLSDVPAENSILRRRTGEVTFKASKLDPVYQSFTVRKEGDDAPEYYKAGFQSGWYKVPAEYIEEIVWDKTIANVTWE